jgi:gas vesicle protein
MNINKIDNDLKSLFKIVDIKEKTVGKNFYFEISATSDFQNLTESFETKRAKVVVRIEKRFLQQECLEMINWSYSVNPLRESSDWIERTSNIENLSKDIRNVVLKKQLSSEYMKTLKTVFEEIEEEIQDVEVEVEPQERIKDLLDDLEVPVTKVETQVLESFEMFSVPDRVFRYHHQGWIKLSDMFRIETVLLNQEGVNLVLFKENYIEVNFSPAF